MKRICLILFLCGASLSLAGSENKASVPASIAILAPIQLTKNQDLWFGGIVIDSKYQGGGLNLRASGGLDTGLLGRGAWIASGMPAAHPAVFTVVGQPGFPWTFYAPGALLDLQKGGSPMTFTPVIVVIDGAVINEKSTATINLGGQLILATKPLPGLYSGHFTASVNYQ
jgi:hypothetical protein